MIKANEITGIIGLIASVLTLIKPSEDGQNRKNIRLAKRIAKTIKKEIKKNGITEQEKFQLQEMNIALTEAYYGLLSKGDK